MSLAVWTKADTIPKGVQVTPAELEWTQGDRIPNCWSRLHHIQRSRNTERDNELPVGWGWNTCSLLHPRSVNHRLSPHCLVPSTVATNSSPVHSDGHSCLLISGLLWVLLARTQTAPGSQQSLQETRKLEPQRSTSLVPSQPPTDTHRILLGSQF